MAIRREPEAVCAGFDNPVDKKLAALEVVGSSARLAAQLRSDVTRLPQVGLPPIAPHRAGFQAVPWKILAAYLVEERRLIEFITGPKVNPETGNYQFRNDICVDCFAPKGQRWRLDDDVYKELVKRAGRINQRLTHFSWRLTGPDDRTDKGVWDTRYLTLVEAGLRSFARHLEDIGLGRLSDALVTAMRRSGIPS
jgi:hypothetical protein